MRNSGERANSGDYKKFHDGTFDPPALKDLGIFLSRLNSPICSEGSILKSHPSKLDACSDCSD
jgi:hypothetical protein